MLPIEDIKQDTNVVQLIDVIGVLNAKGKDLVINNCEGEKQALDITADTKRLKKELDEKRKYYTAPANQYVKQVNGMFKPFITSLDNIDKHVRDKIVKYKAALPKDEVQSKSVYSDKGAMSYRKHTNITIVDKTKIPIEYLEPNMTAIRDALKAGKEVPGVKTTEEDIPVIR
jgi:hypothetical protein